MFNRKNKLELVHQIVRGSKRRGVPSLLAFVLIMLFASLTILIFANIAIQNHHSESAGLVYKTTVAGDVIIRTSPSDCTGWLNPDLAKNIDLLGSSSTKEFNTNNSASYTNTPYENLGDVAEFELANAKLVCGGFQLAENIPPEAVDIVGTISLSFATETFDNNEDIVVFSYSMDGGKNWKAVDSFALLEQMNNQTREGYWSYIIPDLNELKKSEDFLVRVQYVSEPNKQPATAYVDGIALDIQYFEEKRDSGNFGEIQVTNKEGINSQTTAVATIEVEKNSTFGLLGVPTKKREVKSVQLIHPDGSVAEPETKIEEKENGTTKQKEYSIQPVNFDKPGVYKATFAIEENGVVEEKTEEFAWGVLSLNSTKSVYNPGETANLSISAYNGNGDFVCDADLSIQVTNPKGKVATLSTAEGSILKSPQCGPNIVTNTADYITSIEDLSVGQYQLNITGVIDGTTYQAAESFSVEKDIPFDITRIGPSRIYPIAEYEMFLEVIPKDDYFGTVTELVPDLIQVSDINENGLLSTTDENNNYINWQVDWKKGKAYTLSYKFESPTLVDYHFKLGPASFVNYNNPDKKADPLAETTSWQETRPWLIESDSMADKEHNSYIDGDTNRVEIINEKQLRYRAENSEIKDRFFPNNNFFQGPDNSWHIVETQLDIISMGDSRVSFNVNGKPLILTPAVVIGGVTQPIDTLSADYRAQLQMRLEVQKIDQGNKWSHIFFRLPEIEAIEFLVEPDDHTITNANPTSLLVDDQLLLNFSDLVASGFTVSVTPSKIRVTNLKDGWNTLDPTDTFYSSTGADGQITYGNSIYTATTNGTTSLIEDNQLIVPSSETRSFLSFDTSSISDTATVSASDVNTYAESFAKSKTLNTTYSIQYYSGQNGIGATLDSSSADWNSCTTSHGTLNWSNSVGWKSQSLTSPASAVNLTGDTDFKLVEDFTVSTGEYKRVVMRQTEYADTTSDPYLDVTYTAGINVSGNAYNENSTAALTECDGSTNMINLRVQSTTYQTSCNDTTGAFTFTGVATPSSSEAMIIWIDGQTPDGSTVNQYSGTGDVTGMTVQENSVTVHNDSGASYVSNSDLNTFDNGDDDDINYTVSTSDLMIEDGHRLLIKTNEYLDAGGIITTSPAATQSAMDGDIYLESGAAISIGAYALSIGGDYTVESSAGIIFTTGQITTFTGTTTGFSIDTPLNFDSLVFNGTGGGWTFDGDATMTNDLTVTAGTIILGAASYVADDVIINGGTLDVSSGNNYSLSVMGSWDIDGGNFEARSGNVTFNSYFGSETIDSDGTGTDSFYDLTFNDVSGHWDLAGILDVNRNLTITGGTVDNSSGNYNINVGGSWDNDDEYICGTGTVTFDATSGTLSIDADGTGADAFYDLTFNDGGGTATWQLTGLLDVNRNLSIAGGTVDNSAGNYNINIGGGYDNDDGYTRGTETITFDATSGTNLIDGDGTGNQDLYNVTFNDGGGTATWQLTTNFDWIYGTTTLTDGVFDLNNYYWYSYGNFNKTGGSLQMNQASDNLVFQGTFTISGAEGADVFTYGTIQVQDDFTISGDNTFVFGGAGSPRVVFTGTKDPTISISGANNVIGSSTYSAYFDIAFTNSTNTLTFLTAVNAGHCRPQEGKFVINGQNLRCDGVFYAYAGSGIDMASGSLIIGRESYAGGSYSPFWYEAGATENISGGTIQVYGSEQATYGTAYFADGSNFTPTGGTFQFMGTATASIYVAEVDAADFNFWDLTIGNGSTKTVEINTGSVSAIDVDGDLTITAGATLDSNGEPFEVAGNWDNNGTYTHDSNAVTFDGSDTDNTIEAGSSAFYDVIFQGLDGAGLWTFQTNDATVTRTIDIDTSDEVVIATARTITWTGSAFTLDGTISGAGKLTIDSSTTIPTTGTLSSIVRFDSTAGNTAVMPTRTYGGNVEIYNNSAVAARIVTPDIGTHTVSGSLIVQAANTQNVTFAGATNDPTMNITGDLDFGTSGGGVQTITTGANKWTVAGNVDLTAGTFTTEAGNTLAMTGTTKQITSASNPLLNFEISAGSVNNVDAMDVNGTFAITAGTFDHQHGGADINIFSNFTITSGGNWLPSDTYKIILDGDLTLTDSNATPEELSLLQIGASPDTTDLASDIATKGVIVPTGDIFNSHGYDMTLGVYGISVTGTLDLTDDVETDETFITTDGDVTFASGSAVTIDQSTFTFDATSGTDNIFNAGIQDLYNLVINGTVIVEVEDAIDVNGNLTITSGTLDVVSGENNVITVAGAWDNDATFEARSGTVTFDATSGTYSIDADGTGTDAFYDLTFNDGGGSAEWDLAGALDVNRNIAITGGTVDNSSGNYNINIGGGWDNDDSYVRGTETTTFDGASGTYSIDTDSPLEDDFYNVVINDSAGSLHLDLTSQPAQIDGNLTITDGILDLNNYDMYVVGNVSKTGGNLEVNQASDLLAITGNFTVSGNDGSAIFSDGTISIDGNTTISNDDTFGCVAGGWPTFRMQGTTNSTISVSGANNDFGTGTEFCAFTLQKTTNYTLQQLTNITGTTFYFENGIWDVNGQTANFSDKVQINTDGVLKMATGTFTVGRNGSDGDNRAPLSFFISSSEDITGGTIEIYGTANATYGSLFIMDGSNFTPTGGTVKFLGTDATNTLYITEVNTADFNFYNLEIGDGTNAKTLNVNTAATIPIDMNGNLTINANGTFDTNSEAVKVAGNWTNNGTFTADSGTVTLDGAATQTISGTLTGSSAFYDLTITNTSGSYTGCDTAFTPGVDFAASATSTNNYTINTGNVKVEYNSGSTYTFNNINWAGTLGNEIVFRNSNLTSGTWLLNVSGIQSAVSYVSVGRSDASSGDQIIASDGTNTDCSNNIDWLFSSFSVSGSIYNENTTIALTECDSSTNMVNLRVQGTTYQTSCDDTTGAYSFSGITGPTTNESMIIWIEGQTPDGAAVNKYSGSGNVTGIIVEANALTINNDSAVAVSNTDLDTYDSREDNDINYTVDSGSLIVEDGHRIVIKTNENFTPGASVTTSPASTQSAMDGDIYLATGATLNMATNALSVGGDFTTAGTVTITMDSGQATTFTGTTTGFGIEAEDAFDSVTFNGSGGGWTFDAGATLNHHLTVTAGTITLGGTTSVGGNLTINGGTLDVSSGNNYALSVAGSWDIDAGVFQAQSGNVTFNAGSGTLSIDPDGTSTDSFYNLTFNDGGGSAEWDLTGILDVNHNLAITGGTVDNSGGNYAVTLGGGWDNDDTYTCGTETVTFDAASGTLPIDADGTGTDSFYNTIFNDGGGSATWQLTTLMDVNNDFTITGGTFDYNGSNTLTVAGDFTNNDTVTESTGTLKMDGTSGTQYINNTEATSAEASNLYNLEIDDSAGSAIVKSYYPLDTNNNFTITGGTLDMEEAQTYFLTSSTTDAVANNMRIKTTDPAGTANSTSSCNDNETNQSNLVCILNPGSANITWGALPSTIQQKGYMLSDNQGITGTYATGDWTVKATATEVTGQFSYPTYRLEARLWKASTALGSATAITDWGYADVTANITSDVTITFSGVSQTTLTNEVLYVEFAAYFRGDAMDLGSGGPTSMTLTVNEGGTKQQITTPAFSPQINVGGNWDNNDIFYHNKGTVVFDPATGTKTIDSTGASEDDFYNLTINDGAGTGTVQLTGSNLQVDNDFTLTDGTFDLNNLQTLITNSFTKTGGNINMDQSGDHINVDGNFTVSGDGGSSALQDGSIVVAGDVAISNNNVFQMGNNTGYPVFSMDGAVSKTITVSGTGNYFGTTGATGEFDIDKAGGTVVNAGSDLAMWNLVQNTGGLTVAGNYVINADGQYVGLGGVLTMSNGTLSVGSDNLAPSSYANFYVGSGWTEAISAGTIEVDGAGHTTNEAAYFANGSAFTPTGGTFKLIGNDNSTIQIDELDTADFNFYDLTIGDSSNTKTVDIDAASTDIFEVTDNILINPNATFDTNSEPVYIGGNWNNNGTFTADSGIVTFNASDTNNTIDAGTGSFFDIIFEGGDGSGTWYFQNDNATITHTLDVNTSDIVSINTGINVTWTGSSFILGGTINGLGTLVIDSTTIIPTTGTLSCIVRFDATNGNTSVIPERTYYTIEPYNSSDVSARTIVLGTASSQVITLSGYMYVVADGTQNITLSGTSYNPTIIVAKAFDFTGTGDGSEVVLSGTSSWSVSGNVDFTGGTYTASTGNTLRMNGLLKTITTTGNTLQNFEVYGNDTTSVGALDVNGTFTVSSGAFVQAADADLNVAEDFTLALGTTFTAASGTGKLYLDGDLTLTDNTTSKQDLGNVYIGTSPDTTDLASDIATKGITINSGDVLNTHGYEMTIGVYGLNVIGTLDMTDDVETDETFVTTDGDVTFGAASSVTEDQSTITFDAASGTDNIFNPGVQNINNLVINGASLTVEVEDPIIVNNDLTITSGILDVVSGENNQISLGGDWTNNGTFTAQNGTVLLNGSSTQILSGTMTTTSQFYNLTVSNSSGSYSGCATSFTPGIDFAAAATIGGTYTITTGDAKVEYNSGSAYTANNINWNGGAYGDEIIFRNSDLVSGTWTLDVSGTQTAVKYVDVGRSDASSGDTIDARHISNVDCSNTTNWEFDSITLSISDTTIGFGDLTSANARWATGDVAGSDSKVVAHTITAYTAADNGYLLTYNGPLLTSGSDTITAAAITNDDDGTAGTEQFGLGITTAGDCTINSDYNASSPAEYKLAASTTTTLCSETVPTASEVISAYYIANISSETEAGNYSTNITYIMTATF
ncbi:MAG: hypothetical protein WCT33_02345 [Patescibacteria group bacterium]